MTLIISLKIKIRNLERQLGEMQLSSDSQQSATALNKMLEESNRARDRYQADYIAIRGEVLKLQAQLEYIRSGKGGDGWAILFRLKLASWWCRAQSATALRQEVEEITQARDQSSTSNRETQTRMRELERDLSKALTTRESPSKLNWWVVDLVGKDEVVQIERTSNLGPFLGNELTNRFERERECWEYTAGVSSQWAGSGIERFERERSIAFAGN